MPQHTLFGHAEASVTMTWVSATSQE